MTSRALEWLYGINKETGEPRNPLSPTEKVAWDNMFSNRLKHGLDVKSAAKEANEYIKALRSR